MSVLVADDDLTICRILRTALRKENFDVEIVHNGIDALRVLQSPGAPPLALLDWSMPGLDGLEVCRRLHAAGGAAQRFVFLMSGRQDEEDLLRGFDAGVDAFIAKPFDPLRVNSRLRAAQRHLQAAGAHGAPSTAELLRQAARGSTGEVVIRSGERVGRVVFHEGKVTWVHFPGGASLMPLLTDLGMTEQETRLVFEECRKQRLPFLDTLVSWGLIPKEVLSSRLRDELASRLAALLDLPAIEGFFVPETLSFRSGFFYDLAEIEPPTPSEPDSDPLLHATKATLGPPPPLPPAVMALWPEVVRINGLVSAVILDRHSGQSVASEGQPSNASLLRRIARLFLLETDEPFEESLLMSNGHYHLTRSLSPDHLLYLSIDRATNPNIGFVRLLLSQHQQSADRR